METRFNYEYHHWGANKKVMDIINKREKNPETLRLIERRREIAKPGIDLEVLFRNNEKNRWGGGYLELNEPKVSVRTEQNKKRTRKRVKHRGKRRG